MTESAGVLGQRLRGLGQRRCGCPAVGQWAQAMSPSPTGPVAVAQLAGGPLLAQCPRGRMQDLRGLAETANTPPNSAGLQKVPGRKPA